MGDSLGGTNSNLREQLERAAARASFQPDDTFGDIDAIIAQKRQVVQPRYILFHCQLTSMIVLHSQKLPTLPHPIPLPPLVNLTRTPLHESLWVLLHLVPPL